jgi:serine/threonine protein kinase
LKALGSKNHPHLIKLLATYRQKQCYHLMFPYADANLKKYWEDRPTPSFDRDTVLWSLKQMTGIANGLLLIHKFTVTFPLKVAGAADGQGNVRLPKGVKLSVTPGEEMYGRHGDIKPENVLWFSKTSNTTDRMGVLQIADFGLGRFHGRDSRSGVNPDGVMSSLTYEPPECKLREPVSRAYDIWSLGCLYLEYITWLLKGNKYIETFSDFRGEDNPSTGINDDNFFTITTNRYGRTEGKVRDGVKAWVDQLHAHEKCSALIHDILDLTMNELLIIDSQDRCNASLLYSQMALFQKKAQHDLEYLLKSVPRQTKPNTDRTNSAPEIAMDSKTNAKVHFANSQKEKNQASTRPQSKTQSNIKPPNLHKDLVQRGPNTPGLRQGPHPTW